MIPPHRYDLTLAYTYVKCGIICKTVTANYTHARTCLPVSCFCRLLAYVIFLAHTEQMELADDPSHRAADGHEDGGGGLARYGHMGACGMHSSHLRSFTLMHSLVHIESTRAYVCICVFFELTYSCNRFAGRRSRWRQVCGCGAGCLLHGTSLAHFSQGVSINNH